MCKHGAQKLPYLLRYVPDWSRTQQMCDKAILENGRTIKFVPGCYKNQEMCDKAVDNYPHALEFVRKCYKAQEICLATSKFVPDWSVTSKIIQILLTAFYADENILYCNEDSANVAFTFNEMGVLNIDLNNISLGKVIMILIPLFLSDFLLCFEKCKEL